MNPKAMPGWQKDEPMTPTNDAETALKEVNNIALYDSNGKRISPETHDAICAALAKSAKVDGLLDALKPFANVADRIKECATDNRWLEQCLFSMGDDNDPFKWSLTGKAFNDASTAIQRFNGEV